MGNEQSGEMRGGRNKSTASSDGKAERRPERKHVEEDDSDGDIVDASDTRRERARAGGTSKANGSGDEPPRRRKVPQNPHKAARKESDHSTPTASSSTSSSSSSSSDSDSDDSERNVKSSKPRRRQKPAPKRKDPPKSKDEILAEVLSFLCEKDGMSAPLSEVIAQVKQAQDIVKDVVRDSEHLKSSRPSNTLLVTIDSPLKICGSFIKDDHGCQNLHDCPFIHICPDFLLDKCPSGDDPGDGNRCELGHSFRSNHNTEVLQKLNIDVLPDDVLVKLLGKLVVEKDATIHGGMPEFCEDYNSSGGCPLDEKRCNKLHICIAAVMDDDENGHCDGSCGLNHKAMCMNVKRLMTQHGLETNFSGKELFLDLQRRMRNSGWTRKKDGNSKRHQKNSANVRRQAGARPASAQAVLSDDGNVTTEEVCLDYLKLRCSSTCPNGALHVPTPFQFQVKSDRSAAADWLNFCSEQNEALEKAFADVNLGHLDLDDVDPANIRGNFTSLVALLGLTSPPSATASWTADFDKMVLNDSSGSRSLKIRRLATPSSVVSSDQWATVWKWFFFDKTNKWTEYGASTSDDGSTSNQSDQNSNTVEAEYQKYLRSQQPTKVVFKTQSYHYELYFDRQEFVQKNMDPRFLTERKVRRRPEPFASNPPSWLSHSQSSSSLGSASGDTPKFWSQPLSKAVTKRVAVNQNTREGSLVMKVMATFGINTLAKIERIESPGVYRTYDIASKKMLAVYKNKSKALNEKKLLHFVAHRSDASSAQDLDYICQKSIDWRGRVAPGLTVPVTCGQGSHCYTPVGFNKGIVPRPVAGQVWILAKALTGTCCVGTNGLRRLPTNPATKMPYESAVDDSANIGVHVMFDFDHVYPEYAVTI